jgi:hypothetical protein
VTPFECFQHRAKKIEISVALKLHQRPHHPTILEENIHGKTTFAPAEINLLGTLQVYSGK